MQWDESLDLIESYVDGNKYIRRTWLHALVRSNFITVGGDD